MVNRHAQNMAIVSQLQGEITMIKKISVHIYKAVREGLREGRRAHWMFPVLSAALDVPHLLLQVYTQHMPRITNEKAYPAWLRTTLPEDKDRHDAALVAKVDLFKGKGKCLECRWAFLPDGSYGGGFIRLPNGTVSV